MLYYVFDSRVFGSVSQQLSNSKCVFFFLLKKKLFVVEKERKLEENIHMYMASLVIIFQNWVEKRV